MELKSTRQALDHALSLPRKPRCNSIDHGQLRLLYRIAVLKSAGRAELDRCDQDELFSINKRLAYLQVHNLVEADERYLGNAPRWRFFLTVSGKYLTRKLARGRSNAHMLNGLNRVHTIVGNRQLNAAHMKILVFMKPLDFASVSDLIEHTNDHRQTVRSRLKRMAVWGLVASDEQSNAGGNTHFNHWRLTAEGRAVLTALFP